MLACPKVCVRMQNFRPEIKQVSCNVDLPVHIHVPVLHVCTCKPTEGQGLNQHSHMWKKAATPSHHAFVYTAWPRHARHRKIWSRKETMIFLRENEAVFQACAWKVCFINIGIILLSSQLHVDTCTCTCMHASIHAQMIWKKASFKHDQTGLKKS